jgi:hypothetical protein
LPAVTTTAHAHAHDPLLAAFTDVALTAHTRDGPGPVRQLSVSGALHRSGVLALDFQVAAELRALRFSPSACHARRSDELWRHTCFELFAARDDAPAYCEFNFTPSGEWAAYAFAGYRSARRDAAQDRIDVSTQAAGDGPLRLRARMNLASALELDAQALAQASWRLNCAAIIEDNAGALSYWAVHHPVAQPDFHDRAGFAITLGGAARAGTASGAHG